MALSRVSDPPELGIGVRKPKGRLGGDTRKRYNLSDPGVHTTPAFFSGLRVRVLSVQPLLKMLYCDSKVRPKLPWPSAACGARMQDERTAHTH